MWEFLACLRSSGVVWDFEMALVHNNNSREALSGAMSVDDLKQDLFVENSTKTVWIWSFVLIDMEYQTWFLTGTDVFWDIVQV